jgi:Zn-dependent protease with chaperone function
MSTPSEPPPEYPARLNDGHSAAVLDAVVRAAPRGLVILDLVGGQIGCWVWDDVHLAEPPAPGRPIRLSSRTDPGSRLAIADHAVLTTLRPHARYLRRSPIRARQLWTSAGIAAALAATIAFFIVGLPWIARPLSAVIPASWEEPVGDSTVEIINQVFARGRNRCNGADGSAVLQSLTRKLAASVDTPYDIRVSVADSGMVNALAAPGGRVVIFRGLIERAGSADEVAGVLAHEMAHVVRRHPTQGMIATLGWSALLSVFTGGASLSNEATARLAAHLATSAYSRELEAEADEGAIAMLNAAGIGSAGLARFFQSMEQQEKTGIQLPAYLSTHPPTRQRIDAVAKSAAGARAPALSAEEWKSLKAICR